MARPRNPQLEQLRKEAQYLQSRAGDKISRMRRTRGADIAGTKHDPRRAANAFSRMNTNQLNKAIRELKQFNNRNTQFYAARNGELITGKEWRQFKYAERYANKQRRAMYEPIKDRRTPLSDGAEGPTIEAHRRTLGGRSQLMRDMSDPTRVSDMRPTDFESREALKIMTRHEMTNKDRGDWRQEIADANFQKMVSETPGSGDILDAYNQLTSYQKYVMMLSTDIMAGAAHRYYEAKRGIDVDEDDVSRTWASEARSVLDWAARQPRTVTDARRANRAR